MSKLTVTIRENKGAFEGTVTVPGLKTTKLTRKDGTSAFPTSGALKTVARSVANRLGMTVDYAEPQKKAAKKSVKAKCCKPCTCDTAEIPSVG